MTAYGYIRKSVVHDPTRMLSPEMQADAIRRLAQARGDEDVVILSDLDVSGRKGRSGRPGWDEILRAVEDGTAHAVYAYSLSRFTRSLKDLREFTDLCASRSCHVGVAKESIDNSTAMGRAMLSMIGVIYELESELASERVKDAFVTKRASDPSWTGPGQTRYGTREGEDPSAVVAAFREAGSFDGAARLLNDRDVPTRVKGAAWSGSVVRDIVRHHAPDEVGPNVKRRAPAGRRRFRFAQLIECGQCGHHLTGSTDARRGDVRYQCPRSRTVRHARSWVSESKLVRAVSDEARMAALAVRRVQVGSEEDEARARDLEAERARVKAMFRKGYVDEAELDRAMAEIAEQESKLDTRAWIRRVKVPPDVESGDPGEVNAHLRRLFSRVVLDMSEPARRGPSSWQPRMDFTWRDQDARIAVRERVTDEDLADSVGPISIVDGLIDFPDGQTR